MAYKLVISDNANQQLESILDYIVYRLKNNQAAKSLINDIEKAHAKLREIPEVFGYCNDRYLAIKQYRKLTLEKHDYVILYKVKGEVVTIYGIFHMLENYREKL